MIFKILPKSIKVGKLWVGFKWLKSFLHNCFSFSFIHPLMVKPQTKFLSIHIALVWRVTIKGGIWMGLEIESIWENAPSKIAQHHLKIQVTTAYASQHGPWFSLSLNCQGWSEKNNDAWFKTQIASSHDNNANNFWPFLQNQADNTLSFCCVNDALFKVEMKVQPGTYKSSYSIFGINCMFVTWVWTHFNWLFVQSNLETVLIAFALQINQQKDNTI